jgi:hypothetical protein
MTPITLKEVVDCMGATLRNDELQSATDPPLTLNLKSEDGQIYLLPLSERGAARLWETMSYWTHARGSLSEQGPAEPTKFQ